MKFQPTYLYIKEHTLTGMRYLGKTQRNPDHYLGSGKYWKSHIKKHGKEHVRTIWSLKIVDKDELVELATLISEFLNIVDSKKWANLIIENGLDGAPIGAYAGNKNFMYGRTGNKHPMFGKGYLMVGEKNPMYGRTGDRCSCFGRTGDKHPMFGKTGNKNPTSKSFLIDGVKYESLNLASKSLGIPRTTINKRIHSPSRKFAEWKFI